eukprot:TRINITY_DN75489_c0_g1_i1.p1 TRINITY_DN75489_c0_g1~~TRINITY_DN75489_c0_g1_i1.p1  ORF type:complete len:378 (-),score=54.37 TRINITY_DN75489_c0_g1_i1:46-1179(-)
MLRVLLVPQLILLVQGLTLGKLGERAEADRDDVAAAAAGMQGGTPLASPELADVGSFLAVSDLTTAILTSPWQEDAPKYWPVQILLLIMVVSGSFMGGLAYVLLDYGKKLSSDDCVAGTLRPASLTEPLLDTTEPEDDAHRVPWQQYAVMLFWFMLLTCQAAFTRLVCQFGVPHDCHPHMTPVKVVYDIQFLFGFGFVLATLVSMCQPQRWAYIFCWDRPWRGIVFVVVFFGTSPVFGSLDLVPFLTHFSLTAGGMHSIVNNLVLCVLVISVVFLLGWHLYYAYTTNPLTGFVAYVFSRVLLWSFYVAYGIAASAEDRANFHLHHYIIGFLCASLAEFNHPVSLILLAIGSGIMSQGISAYDADPIVYERPRYLRWG